MFGFLGSLVSGIANVLNVVVTKLVPGLIKIVGAALEKLSTALESFFKELGLIESEDHVEENLNEAASVAHVHEN